MVKYQAKQGSMQARPYEGSSVVCDYHQDLIWTSAAWQKLGESVCNDERWSRYVTISGLPAPNSVTSGTIMELNPTPAFYVKPETPYYTFVPDNPAASNTPTPETIKAPMSTMNKVIMILVVGIILFLILRR